MFPLWTRMAPVIELIICEKYLFWNFKHNYQRDTYFLFSLRFSLRSVYKWLNPSLRKICKNTDFHRFVFFHITTESLRLWRFCSYMGKYASLKTRIFAYFTQSISSLYSIFFFWKYQNALNGRIWISENPYSRIVYAKHFFPIFPFSSLENTRNPKREHLQEKDQTIVIQNLINYCIPL